jgi:hypothetical protein
MAFRTFQDVHYPVARGSKPDMERAAYFGSDYPISDIGLIDGRSIVASMN